MSDPPSLRTNVIDEIGIFEYGKTNWLEYCSNMELCFSNFEISTALQKKLACLHSIGAKTLKILKTLIRPTTINEETVTYDFIIDTLDRHFYPHPDASFYVSKFQLRKQRHFETFFEYVVALRKIMANCNFSRKNQHSKLRNQLISGSKEDLKSKFNPNSMSLSQVFEVGLLWDDARIRKPAPHPRNHKARKNRIPKCFRCGQAKPKHNNEPCLFEWANCSSCNIKGHVSLVCKYKDITCSNCSEKGHICKLCKRPAATPITALTNQLTDLTIAQG